MQLVEKIMVGITMNMNIMSSVQLLGLITVWLLAMPFQVSLASDGKLRKHTSSDVNVSTPKYLRVCAERDKNCVTSLNVLYDLYPKSGIAVIDNFGLIKSELLIHVILSAKVQHGKDTYAVFITQANEIDEKQGLSTCNACKAKLGIVIYQFHNKWKLFGVNPDLDDTGKGGSIRIEEGSFSVYSLGMESFLLTFDSRYGSQGYESTYRDIFIVNEAPLSSVLTDARASISHFGRAEVEESTCNAKKDGEYWVGSVELERINQFRLQVIVDKIISSCVSRKPIKRERVVLVKKGSEKLLTAK